MSRSLSVSDGDLLETWRERLVVFHIDPNQLAYIDEDKVVANGAFGQVRKAIFTASTLTQLDESHGEEVDLQPITVTVAVKGLKIHLGIDVDRFEKLKNDHILEFIGFHFLRSDGQIEALLVSPWLENGQSVRYVKQRNLTVAQRLHLLMDAAEGLHYLHTRQPPICHGDIKGSNVLVKHDGRAAICDFGLAQVLDDDFPEIASQTVHRGTIRWTSPERLDGNASLLPPADVWSWGWLIWELLVGKIPFHTVKNGASVIYHIVTLRLPACEKEAGIADVPALVRLIQMCWQKDPDSRLKMSECINFLKRILREIDPLGAIETKQGPEDLDFSKLPLTYSPVPQVNSPVAFAVTSLSESPITRNTDDGKRLPTPIPSPPQDVRSIKSASPARTKILPRPPTLARENSRMTVNPRKDLPPLPPPKSPARTVEAVFPDEHPQPYVFTLENSPPAPAFKKAKHLLDSRADARVSLDATQGTEPSSSRNGSPLPGLLGITKSLFRTSKKQRKVSSSAAFDDIYQTAGHDYEYNPWDLLDVPHSNMNSPSSATNGSTSDGNSELSNVQLNRLHKTLQRIESSQAHYLQEQREIKQYLSQVGQWLSQAPIFGAPALRLENVQVPSAALHLATSPRAKPVPGTPSIVATRSSLHGTVSRHSDPEEEDLFGLNRPAAERLPAHGRPKEYNSVSLAALALRDAMLSDEDIPRAIGSTTNDSKSSLPTVQSEGETYDARKSFPVLDEPSGNELIKEEEIQVYGDVRQDGKSKVLKGVIVATNRVVGIKCINFRTDPRPEDLDRYMVNLSGWMDRQASREHPNVAKLVGKTILGSTLAIVSEWYSGGTITDYLRDNPHAHRKSLLRQVTEGLEYLHQKPTILHNNIKPSNVLVDADGKVKLSDVGVVSFLTVTKDVDIYGKPGDSRWTAPEILEGDPYSTASDVYSFGCLALVILSNQVPYASFYTDAAVSKAIFRGELPVDWDSVSGLHPTWRLCWNQGPSSRPTMRAVLGSVGYW
ncbi:hypothetical protein FRC04_012232 [Tulasnella sp. 424]|nr:hypothetical protein FRC04_012232 [Tulasnella sp. 424]